MADAAGIRASVSPAALLGKPIPERKWIVPDWVPHGAVTGLYGDAGLGKTLLAQQLQTSTALGRRCLGMSTDRTPSLGIYCEDSEDELRRRQRDINLALEVDDADLENVHWRPR